MIERALVAPADEVRSGALLEHLERAGEGVLERALAEPEHTVPLADFHVAQDRTDRRGHVRGERPGRRRPDEERLPRTVDEGEADGQRRILAILVALVHRPL